MKLMKLESKYQTKDKIMNNILLGQREKIIIKIKIEKIKLKKFFLDQLR